jgi:GrpB-like predicted nucleotidyltransferase (UPF0157 family)
VTIAIVGPFDRWPGDFRRAAARIREAFGPLALRIDHIGSTSVPGLAAKDVIDIQVTVATLRPEPQIVDALVSLDLLFRDDLRRDHVPAGAVDAPDAWSKLYGTTPVRADDAGSRAGPPLHVHVRAAGTANQRYALLFRDHLRADPAVAAAYLQVKRALAAAAPEDWDLYYDVKDAACDIIMASAERWAAQTGWEPGPSDA